MLKNKITTDQSPSSKDKLKKNKGLLPPQEPPNTQEPPKDLPPQEVIIPKEIKPTGSAHKVICSIYNFGFRGQGPILRPEERELFKESSDQLEVEILKLLPEWLQEASGKYGGFSSAALGIIEAFIAIKLLRSSEKPESKLPKDTPGQPKDSTQEPPKDLPPISLN